MTILFTPSSPLAPYSPDGNVEVRRSAHNEGRGVIGVWNYYVRDAWCRRGVLCAMADHQNERLAKWLRWGANPNLRFILGQYPHDTLLSFAINTSDEVMLRLVLAAGADPNLPAGKRRESPLCQALRLGKDELALILLASGASWRSAGLSANSEWVTAAFWIETSQMDEQFQEHLRQERSDRLGKVWRTSSPLPTTARPRL